MAETAGMRFSLAIPAATLTTPWLTEVLHHLWDAGITYTRTEARPATWDAQFRQASCQGFVSDYAREPSRPVATVQEFVAGAPKHDGGLLEMTDGAMVMAFIVREPMAGTTDALRWLAVRLDKNYLVGGVFPQPPSYYYTTFLTWCERLCEIVQPLYAFGERPFDEVHTDAEEQAMRDFWATLAERLASHDYPTTIPGIAAPPFVYLPNLPRAVQQIQPLLKDPTYHVQQLGNDGWLLVPRVPRYEPEAEAAAHLAETGYHAVAQVRQMLATGLQQHRKLTDAEAAQARAGIRQAREALLRAESMFGALGDARRERLHQDLATLTNLEQRVQEQT